MRLRITGNSALNRVVDDWGKLLGDTAAVTALLDRLLHHAHVLKCGPRSWRTKVQTTVALTSIEG
jgi:DNA replication protein DnaC